MFEKRGYTAVRNISISHFENLSTDDPEYENYLELAKMFMTIDGLIEVNDKAITESTIKRIKQHPVTQTLGILAVSIAATMVFTAARNALSHDTVTEE